MKLILRFLKPHLKLCVLTIVFMAINVINALIIPAFAAEMLNEGTTAGTGFSLLLQTGIKMAVAAVIAGLASIAGDYVCAELTSKVGADMRKSLYSKTLTLSGADFGSFGTASVTTRTVSDVTNIQFALLSCFQMVFPVPIIFVTSLILAFNKDRLNRIRHACAVLSDDGTDGNSDAPSRIGVLQPHTRNTRFFTHHCRHDRQGNGGTAKRHRGSGV